MGQGNNPPYLKVGECDCGNITKDKTTGLYSNYISKKIGGAPQCIKDPCNPGGYTYTDPNSGLSYCKCDAPNYANDSTGNYCINLCSEKNNPCLNGGTCSVSGGKAICNCPSGTLPPYCGNTCGKDGEKCNSTEGCCDKKSICYLGSCMKF